MNIGKFSLGILFSHGEAPSENLLGRTDLEEKSSADEREVHKSTPSEETAID